MQNQDGKRRVSRRNQPPQAEPARLQIRRDSASFSDSENLFGMRKAKRNSMNARLVSGILSLLLAVAASAFTFLPGFRVQAPVVSGSTRMSVEEITYYTGLRNLPIYQVDPELIRSTLLKRYPEIRDIAVTVAFPSEVNILIQQRKALVEWDFGGSKFWIDQDGRVMNENLAEGDKIYVLGDSFPGAKNRSDRKVPSKFSSKVVRSILNFGGVLPEGKTLFYTYENGFGWDTDAGYRLWLGSNDNALDEKLAMAESLKKYFIEEEIEPDMVSLEYTHAPYYRFSQ